MAFSRSLIPRRRRYSLTRRSWRVWLARSTRPLACWVLAWIASISSPASARPNWVVVAPLAGLYLVDAKDAVAVGVERHRSPVLFQMPSQHVQVERRGLAGGEPELHQTPGGVVDEDDQGGAGATPLEPVVSRAVDLDQLEKAPPPLAAVKRPRGFVPLGSP